MSAAVATSTSPSPTEWPHLAGRVRDRLGRAHYDRMRTRMLPTLGHLSSWGELTEATRELYRRHTEYLVPAVLQEFAGGDR